MAMLREQRNTTVTTASTQIASGQMRRAGIIISSPKNNTIWVSFQGAAAIGTGLPIRPGQPPVVLTDKWVSEALTDEVNAVTESGIELIGVIDLIH